MLRVNCGYLHIFQLEEPLLGTAKDKMVALALAAQETGWWLTADCKQLLLIRLQFEGNL